MKLFSTEHRFQHPWHIVSAANWVKYPNEITSHVTHVDYLSRSLNPSTGILHTERLITCKQTVPQFLTKLFGGSSEVYVYEISEVNTNEKSLTLRTKNLTLCNLMTVHEVCTYIPSPSNPSSETLFSQEANISSLNGFAYIRNAIEDFCLERFRSNATKGKLALEHVLDKICLETREAMASYKEYLPSSTSACTSSCPTANIPSNSN